MAYFKRFPIVNYKLNGDIYKFIDVSKRLGVVNEQFFNPNFYIEYVIQEGDTPIIIADKVYDDAELAWVILHFNQIVDYFEEWPLEQESLDQYILQKYNDPYAIHHYESLLSGNIVQASHPAYDRVAVNNYEHEVAVNDDKRQIKILTSDYVGEYTNQHNDSAERL